MALREVQPAVVVGQREAPAVEQVTPRPLSTPGDHASIAQLLSENPDDATSRRHGTARALAVTTFVVSLAAVALILLNPDGNPMSALVDRVSAWLETRNVSPLLAQEQSVERLANVVLFVPFGLVGMLAWRRRGVLWWSGAGFLLSLAAELAQYRFLPGRIASADDVVGNTAGAFVGALLAALLLTIGFAVRGLTRVVRRNAENRRFWDA